MAHASSTSNKAIRPQAAARSKTKSSNQNAANVVVKSPVRSWRRRLPLASDDQIAIIEKYFAPGALKSRRFEADYDEFLPRELSATTHGINAAHGWDGREVGFAFCFGESRCSGDCEYYRFVPPTRPADFSLIPSGGKSAGTSASPSTNEGNSTTA